MKSAANRGLQCLQKACPRKVNNPTLELFRQSSGFTHARAIYQEQLNGIREAGTYKEERIILGKQGASIKVEGTRKKILNFCANNYLGLASNPEVVESAKHSLDEYGSGLSSVRFICGTQDIHKSLEKKISEFHGREDAILYPSCFDANAGLFECIIGPEDAILSDQLNHASIIDGIRLCKATKYRYKHSDMKDLEFHLRTSTENGSRMKLIVTDGVFSMDGNVARLPEICQLADQYNAMVMIDECHSTGFFGQTGRGTEEFHNLKPGRIDLINSTLGKAMGGASGGYTTGPTEIIELLRQRSRPYLFSNSVPPAAVASASKVFDIVMSNPGLVQQVAQNTVYFRRKMDEAGFKLEGNPQHPICPVMLGDAKLAVKFADLMLENGIYVIGFSYPVVPKGEARVRVQISASHSLEDIDKAVTVFTQVGKELNVIQ